MITIKQQYQVMLYLAVVANHTTNYMLSTLDSIVFKNEYDKMDIGTHYYRYAWQLMGKDRYSKIQLKFANEWRRLKNAKR